MTIVGSEGHIHVPKPLDTRQKISRKVRLLLNELHLYKPRTYQDPRLTFINSRDQGLDSFHFPQTDYRLVESDLIKNADVVNLHWVAGFLDYQNFFANISKPVVWTLHDINPFSGGNHYPEEYFGVDSSGIPLIRSISQQEDYWTRKNLSLKIEVLKRFRNLRIVVLSDWMKDLVKNSEVLSDFPVTKIYNSVDINVFKVRDAVFCRELLGLNVESKVILFVADHIKINRKGFKILLKALERLSLPNLQLCVVGRDEISISEGINCVNLGVIRDELLMSVIYNAADLFVLPSLEDNLPNTLLESLCCGTPAVGFNIGGVSEMIENGKSGILTDKISSEDLCLSIIEFFENQAGYNTHEISQLASKRFSPDTQVKKYVNLYESIV